MTKVASESSGHGSVSDVRRGFGARLRALREDAGLTGQTLAAALGWHSSKVSRLELGQRGAAASDVVAWVAAVGQPDDLAGELLAELRQVQIEHKRLRQAARHGLSRVQRLMASVDTNTTMIRAFELSVVPGLVQTPEYARDILRAATRLWPVHDLDAAVSVRMDRQRILTEPHRTTMVLIGEGALRYRVSSSRVMTGQLNRIGLLLGIPGLEIRVLPFAQALPASVPHGFWIYDDVLVRAETLTAALVVRDPDDIAVYADHFTLLWESSVTGEAARLLIARVLEELDVE